MPTLEDIVNQALQSRTGDSSCGAFQGWNPGHGMAVPSCPVSAATETHILNAVSSRPWGMDDSVDGLGRSTSPLFCRALGVPLPVLIAGAEGADLAALDGSPGRG